MVYRPAFLEAGIGSALGTSHRHLRAPQASKIRQTINSERRHSLLPSLEKAAKKGFALDQRARRLVGAVAGAAYTRRAVGLGEQHAHLGALEEGHRIARRRGERAVEAVARLGKTVGGEVEDAELEIGGESGGVERTGALVRGDGGRR